MASRWDPRLLHPSNEIKYFFATHPKALQIAVWNFGNSELKIRLASSSPDRFRKPLAPKNTHEFFTPFDGTAATPNAHVLGKLGLRGDNSAEYCLHPCR